MSKAAKAHATEHHRADEKGAPVNFFTRIHDYARLNSVFVQLTTNEGYSQARAIIEPMMRWYEDADGNFVERFQTTGSDPPIWELYLFAKLIEANYILNRDKKVPDFCCSSVLDEFNIEAVTVGLTTSKGKSSPQPRERLLLHRRFEERELCILGNRVESRHTSEHRRIHRGCGTK